MTSETSEGERGYFERRSDWHRQMAERSDHETQRNLHQRFASLYADRARNEVGKD